MSFYTIRKKRKKRCDVINDAMDRCRKPIPGDDTTTTTTLVKVLLQKLFF